MKLYLAQHGQAVDKKIDPERPLSEQGRLQVRNVANYLRLADVDIEGIYHSGKSRAAQTAEIFASVLGIQHLDKLEGLNPNDAVEPLVQTINSWTTDSMLVGHIPFLPRMISRLLTNDDPTDSHYLPGNIVCLEKDNNNQWSLAGCCTYSSFNKNIDNDDPEN